MTHAHADRPETIVSVIASGDEHGMAIARAIISAAEKHDGVSPVSDQAMLAVAQGQRELLLFGEHAVVGIVGDGEIDLVVRPEYRGHGMGTAALDELVSRSSGSASSRLLPLRPVRAWVHGKSPAAAALLTRGGFAPIRSLFRMALDPELLPAGSLSPASLTPPTGFSLRAFRNDGLAFRDDAKEWVCVNAAAFAHHPEQGRMTVTDFTLIAQEDWFNPGDLFLLFADGEKGQAGAAAGSTWIKTTQHECELYAIGIHPDHAGHGLGRYLLDVTLARMAQHHPNRVSLYVDGDNSRAVKMYEAAGFTIVSHSQQWELPAMSVANARMEA